MPRRTYRSTAKGQAFAVEWVEYFVTCVVEDCEEEVLISPCGMANNIKLAEQGAKENAPEWMKIKGAWYCPKHKRGAK